MLTKRGNGWDSENFTAIKIESLERHLPGYNMPELVGCVLARGITPLGKAWFERLESPVLFLDYYVLGNEENALPLLAAMGQAEAVQS